MITITVQGGAALQAKLARLQNMGEIAARPLRDGCMLISNDLRRYPPISDANLPPSPPPGRFYTRGVGGFYVRKDGGMRRISTSQRLGVSWGTRVTSSANVARGEIASPVTYAGYVHGTEKQAKHHARRGWKTVQALFDKHKGGIVANLAAAVSRALRT